MNQKETFGGNSFGGDDLFITFWGCIRSVWVVI
jgi:hypothetical protein